MYWSHLVWWRCLAPYGSNPTRSGPSSPVSLFPLFSRAVSAKKNKDAETLASLTDLNISHNNLRAVPDAVIDFCEALRVLDLAGNRIGFRGRTLPRTITRLVSLEDLSVAENSLQVR